MYPARVFLSEVSPRDGLQIEPKVLSTEQKLQLIDALGAAGLPRIEVAGFVNPKLVPQMADAAAIVAGLQRQPGTRYGAFVPNVKGAQLAIAAGIDDVKCGMAASDAFNVINVRMDRATALRALREIGTLPRRDGCKLVGTIGTAFGCPYEGEIPRRNVEEAFDTLAEIGCTPIFLADTTGMGNPASVAALAEHLMRRAPGVEVGLHLHNTRGLGAANALAGLGSGIAHFEGSVGGLGGCPFAPRAVGNVCTEDLAHMMAAMGINIGVDLDRLIAAAQLAETLVGRTLPGMVMKAGKATERHPRDATRKKID